MTTIKEFKQGKIRTVNALETPDIPYLSIHQEGKMIHNPVFKGGIVCLFVGLCLNAADVKGQTVTKRLEQKIVQLETELDTLRKAYDQKILDIQQLLKKWKEEKEDAEKQAELDALLNAAKSMAQEEKKDESTVAKVFRGGQRQMQALNPNISLTGDFFGSMSSSREDMIRNPGDFTDGRNRFFMREAEFHVIAPLDPFTRGKFFLGIPGAGEDPLSFMIGEAYMEWLNFPGNMNLKIGLFNTNFGILNRWHDHGLPQVDRPRPLVHLFGLENFGGVGISANILLPGLWSHANELDIEVVTGGNGVSFDEDSENVIVVGHLKNYYDLTRNTYLEIGLSGAHGHWDRVSGLETWLAGLDLTCKWTPAGRSHYRTIEWRNELFLSHREKEGGGFSDRFGFYSYVSNKLGAWSWLGVRFGFSQIPQVEDQYEWDISPYFDFWQSEFVMIRLQYSYTYRNYTENDHSFFIQSVWSMGPHKHEAY
jgi:hypothetical protein